MIFMNIIIRLDTVSPFQCWQWAATRQVTKRKVPFKPCIILQHWTIPAQLKPFLCLIYKMKAISAVRILMCDTFLLIDANFHKLHNSHKQLSTHTDTCACDYKNVIYHATWVQTCELKTLCSVACRLSTAFLWTLKKIWKYFCITEENTQTK